MKSIIKESQTELRYSAKPIKSVKLRELDYLIACKHRGLLTNPNKQKLLARLQAGDAGELDLVDFLIDRLPASWRILRNVWLEIDGSTTEVDILILTPHFWWVLEVKNYRGNFEYRDQTCYLNDDAFPDQIAACRNRMRVVNKIASKMHPYVPEVYCTMVFINELCQVTADVQPDIQLMMRYQLPRHLNDMLQRHHTQTRSINFNDSLSVILHHEINHPYLPQQLDSNALEEAIKGINCIKCHHYNVKINHRQVECLNCHHTFTKTEAILQAACELGILYYTNPQILTSANLYQFTAGKISQKRICLILKKHLPKYGQTQGTYYENYALPFEQVKNNLKQYTKI